jgi:hypothetical protein
MKPFNPFRRVLDSIDRVSEVLFGLIMVLTFTGSLSVAEAGREDVRTMLIGALGCNLAWGVIDAMFYLMGRLADNGRLLATYLAVRKAADPQKAQRLIADALPPVVASILSRQTGNDAPAADALPEPPALARLSTDDWLGHRRVFIVFVSMFPVATPFIFMQSVGPALRVQCHRHRDVVSDGLRLRTHDRASPVACGYGMVVLGSMLTGLTMALGG